MSEDVKKLDAILNKYEFDEVGDVRLQITDDDRKFIQKFIKKLYEKIQ
jgi:hypothetical protein